MKHGDIVKTNREFLGEPPGTLCYVYEEYNNGVSVITQSGVDLGGFSGHELNYLEFVKESGFLYPFKNVMQLDWDFKEKILPVFN